MSLTVHSWVAWLGCPVACVSLTLSLLCSSCLRSKWSSFACLLSDSSGDVCRGFQEVPEQGCKIGVQQEDT